MGLLDTLNEFEPFAGNKACAGCAGTLVVRWTLKVLGERVFAVIPAGCMSAVGFVYPQMAFGINAMISPFAATGAVLSGVAAGIRVKGIENAYTVAFAGDGATADIGLQSLSGAFDRREKIIYICYDNEAYMNTGVQKSGATPLGAWTTTSTASRSVKKDLLAIAVAHGIPYAATASVGYPADFFRKLRKAALIDGPSFLHVHAPCPTGWGYPPNATIRVAKSAVETGLWKISEWENGTIKLTIRPQELKPVEEYLDLQGRFKNLDNNTRLAISVLRDRSWLSD